MAADEVAEVHAGFDVGGLDVGEVAVGPGRGVEGGDADAGAVELGDDVGRRAAVDGDETRGPERGELVEAERGADPWQRGGEVAAQRLQCR